MEKFGDIWYYGFGLLEAEKLRANMCGVALPFWFSIKKQAYYMERKEMCDILFVKNIIGR